MEFNDMKISDRIRNMLLIPSKRRMTSHIQELLEFIKVNSKICISYANFKS